eukprot:Gregarina_sp_Poly_1__2198@NODE_1585_length_3778_cov_16_119914_g1046_i0_p2_GENE_NODE_1585_length_3778_cov_16_119914_g1046_i0NODE_1585_length_3778_cov_16_119914_g1046_i0_p2_ORF_typecomplete_len299_score34_62_NODE_1585_length_3778_cov_16_119914_g1046_i028423738
MLRAGLSGPFWPSRSTRLPECLSPLVQWWCSKVNGEDLYNLEFRSRVLSAAANVAVQIVDAAVMPQAPTCWRIDLSDFPAMPPGTELVVPLSDWDDTFMCFWWMLFFLRRFGYYFKHRPDRSYSDRWSLVSGAMMVWDWSREWEAQHYDLAESLAVDAAYWTERVLPIRGALAAIQNADIASIQQGLVQQCLFVVTSPATTWEQQRMLLKSSDIETLILERPAPFKWHHTLEGLFGRPSIKRAIFVSHTPGIEGSQATECDDIEALIDLPEFEDTWSHKVLSTTLVTNTRPIFTPLNN